MGNRVVLPKIVQKVQLVFGGKALLLFRRVESVEIPRIIEIKGRVGRHGENLPVLGIHDQSRRILAAPCGTVRQMGIVPVRYALFDDGLDIRVNGCNDRLPVLRFNDCLLYGGPVLKVAVTASVHPVQGGIVFVLKARDPVVPVDRETDELGSQRPVRV